MHIPDPHPRLIPNSFSMSPVLAEKAVEGASVVEDRKILEPVFWAGGIGKSWESSSSSTRTNPISHTIGGQPIIIPTHISFKWRDSLQDPILSSPQATIAPATFWNLAFINTDGTCGMGCISRKGIDQSKWYSGSMMGRFDTRSDSLFSRSEAVYTDREGL
jgi:hypothetical protein